MLRSESIFATTDRVDELIQMSLQLEPNVPRGAKLYGRHCIGCHRKSASGDAQDVIPALAGQREAYLIKQLADFAEREREAPQMHAVVSKAELNEPQSWADLASYLSRLPAMRRPQRGDDRWAEQGAVIFQEECVECHQSDARGDEDGFVPSLRDQHYSYLVAQMRSFRASHRKNVDQEFMQFIDRLGEREINALADYLSRLQLPVRDRGRLRDDGNLRN